MASPLLALLLTSLCGVVLFVAARQEPGGRLSVFFVEPLKDLRGWAEICSRPRR